MTRRQKGGGGVLLALEATGLLTQDADPGGKTLVDSHNGFNDLSRLEMFCMVRNRWPAEGKACIQLLQALDAASPPPSGRCNGHSPEPRGGYPG